MIATAYSGKQMNTLLNRFHMWFPGGIVLGSLVSLCHDKNELGLGSSNMDHHGSNIDICIPLLWTKISRSSKKRSGFAWVEILKSMVTPLFIFMCVCMTLTAISEFGPTQWAQLVLAKSGAEPMVILALITGLMAVGRYFGGEFVHKFDRTGVLLGSADFHNTRDFPLQYTDRRDGLCCSRLFCNGSLLFLAQHDRVYRGKNTVKRSVGNVSCWWFRYGLNGNLAAYHRRLDR